jgi:Ca2+-binding RTX toxin-like protein
MASFPTEENDTIWGTTGNDVIDGLGGNDVIYAVSGGHDTINGNAGDDSLYFDRTLDALDSIDGGTGYDILHLAGPYPDLRFDSNQIRNVEQITFWRGGSVRLTVEAGTLQDHLTVFAAGLGATETLYIDASMLMGTVSLIGGAGNDELRGGSGKAWLHGGAGDDFLIGGAGPDQLEGGSGKNRLSGGAGNDTYFVESASDTVLEQADQGTDIVATELGSRTDYSQIYVLPAFVENLSGRSRTGQGVQGNSLDNDIRMGIGSDLIVLQDGGNDTVSASEGNDYIYYGGAFTSADSNDGGGGFDTVGLLGTYVVTLGVNGLRNVEKLALYSSGNENSPNHYDITMVDMDLPSSHKLMVVAQSLLSVETLRFNGAAESGGSFNIRGGKGNDTIETGAGNDKLWGNLGADQLRGGAGKDFFEYHSFAESTGTSRDRILDFGAGDRINLVRIDADGNGANGDSKFSFIGANAFGGVAGQLRVTGSGSDWLVEADIDGDSIADLVIGVTTIGGHVLGSTDFFM